MTGLADEKSNMAKSTERLVPKGKLAYTRNVTQVKKCSSKCSAMASKIFLCQVGTITGVIYVSLICTSVFCGWESRGGRKRHKSEYNWFRCCRLAGIVLCCTVVLSEPLCFHIYRARAVCEHWAFSQCTHRRHRDLCWIWQKVCKIRIADCTFK